MDRAIEEMNIKFEVEDEVRKAGLRLNPTSSVKKPIDEFDFTRVDVCHFCKSEITQEQIEIKVDGLSFPRWQQVACTCPDNLENTAKYQSLYQVAYERISAEHKRKRVQKLHAESKTPAKFLDRTFDRFTLTPFNQKAYDTALKYAKEFDPAKGEGLLFSGTVGTGKTHLAAAIAMELMEQEQTVTFGTINTLLSEIRYSFNDERADSEAELFRRYTTCDLLIIDDLGKERVSDWTEQIVFDLINTRYEQCKSLIITTNLSLKELRTKYRDSGEALVDRILEMCKGVKLDGDSWRRKQLV